MGTACKEAQKRMDLLDEKARERFIPLNAQLELTSECNLECVHCYIAKDEKKRELSYAEIINLLDQLADAGCLWLNLTGGEALTRPDFFNIAHYARKKHFAVRIFTNATLIDEGTAHKIARISPLSVEISVYGVKPGTHDAITRVNGSFERTMQAVKMLRKENVRVVIKTVLMKKNIFEVEDIFRLCRNLGLEHQFDVQICPRNDGSPEPTIYLLDDDELKDYFLKDIPERIEYEEEEPSAVARQKPTCSPGTNTCGISSYGDVYPCGILLVRMGNIRDKPFLDIWRSQAPEIEMLRALKQYRQLPRCGECDLVFYCKRCHGLAKLFRGDFSECDPLGRRMAEVMKKVNEIRKGELWIKETASKRSLTRNPH